MAFKSFEGELDEAPSGAFVPFEGELDAAPENVKPFTGEIDQPSSVKPFTGQLDQTEQGPEGEAFNFIKALVDEGEKTPQPLKEPPAFGSQAVHPDRDPLLPGEEGTLKATGKAFVRGTRAQLPRIFGGFLEMIGRRGIVDTTIEQEAENIKKGLSFRILNNLPPPFGTKGVSLEKQVELNRSLANELDKLSEVLSPFSREVNEAALQQAMETGVDLQDAAKKWEEEHPEMRPDPVFASRTVWENFVKRPIKTVAVLSAENYPNMLAAIGAYIVAGPGGAFLTSVGMEAGDQFIDGKEFLIKKYGSQEAIPEHEWALLVDTSTAVGFAAGAFDFVPIFGLMKRSGLHKEFVKNLTKAGLRSPLLVKTIKNGLRQAGEEIPTEAIQELIQIAGSETIGNNKSLSEKFNQILAATLAAGPSAGITGGAATVAADIAGKAGGKKGFTKLPEGFEVDQDAPRGTSPEPSPDRRQQPHPGTEERRQDEGERVRVEHMTPEQLRKALLTSQRTELPNERAYDESSGQRLENQSFMDLDDFKALNDEFTYEGGDQLIDATGKIIREEAEAAGIEIKPYHLHGDEFITESSDPKALDKFSKRVQEKLANAKIKVELPDGRTLIKQGLGVSYGIGNTRQQAEATAKESKAERLKRGLRTGRERGPGPVVETLAEGQPDRQREAARELIETPEFKTWFGDSKVVDENGEPLVVYHGTAVDFEIFDSEAGTEGAGAIWFSYSPELAEVYAKGAETSNGGARIIPVYLKAENIFNTDNPKHRKIFDALVKNGALDWTGDLDLRVNNEGGLWPDWQVNPFLIPILKEKGFDAVNIIDSGGEDSIGIFSTTQIKSIFFEKTPKKKPKEPPTTLASKTVSAQPVSIGQEYTKQILSIIDNAGADYSRNWGLRSIPDDNKKPVIGDILPPSMIWLGEGSTFDVTVGDPADGTAVFDIRSGDHVKLITNVSKSAFSDTSFLNKYVVLVKSDETLELEDFNIEDDEGNFVDPEVIAIWEVVGTRPTKLKYLGDKYNAIEIPDQKSIAKQEIAKPAEKELSQAEKKPKEPPATSSKTIDEAREQVQKELEDVVKEDPKKGTKFYSGIPSEAIADSAGLAARGLQDSLGIPVKEGVEVTAPEQGKQPGIFNPFKSPSKVSEKYPAFSRFFILAEIAQNTQETLRAAFNRRLGTIDHILGGGLAKAKDFGKTYRANKKLYTEIRLTEDMLGKEFTKQELGEQFGVNDEVIRALRLIRAAYNHALTLANKTRELRGKDEIHKRTGYVPHFFHNYFIVVDGEILTSAKTLRQAVSLGNKLARKGSKVVIRPKEFSFPGEATQAAVVGDGAYFRLKSNLERSLELTLEESQELLEGIVRRRGRSRFVGNFYQRKGVRGFETNLDWVDRHYFNMISRYSALDPFKSKSITIFERKYGSFDKQQKGMAQYTKNYINDINGVPTSIEELINNSIANTPLLGKFLGHYLGDRPALQVAGATTNAVAIAKLGLYNLSAALVNGTQILGTQTLLGPKWASVGFAKAVAINAELVKRKFVGSATIKSDIGILKKVGVDVQQGLESGAGYSKAAQMGKLFRTSTVFFQGVERMLRQSTSLGAYYKALSEGKTRQEAIDFAIETNRRVNFDYSIADAPSFIRRSGPLGQILFQFKKFPVKMLEFITSLKGAEKARFWIPFFLVSGYFAFPGMDALNNILKEVFDFDMELELKEFLMAWADDDDDDDEEKRKAKRKAKMAVAKTIMYGVFSNEELGGVDISRRIGGGDFIPSQTRDIWGPFFSSVVRATQLAAREEWTETLRAITTAPGNIAIALQNEGEITSPWDRNRLVTKLSPADRVKKGVGFRPVKEAIETDISRIIKKKGRELKRNQREVIDELIKTELKYDKRITSIKERGYDKEKEKRLLLNAENTREGRLTKIEKRMEKQGITFTSEQISSEIERKKLTRAQRAFLQASEHVQSLTAGVFRFSRNNKEGDEDGL